MAEHTLRMHSTIAFVLGLCVDCACVLSVHVCDCVTVTRWTSWTLSSPFLPVPNSAPPISKHAGIRIYPHKRTCAPTYNQTSPHCSHADLNCPIRKRHIAREEMQHTLTRTHTHTHTNTLIITSPFPLELSFKTTLSPQPPRGKSRSRRR